MKDTQDAMVTFLYLSAKEQESLRRRLSSSPSYSQPAHMFTKEVDTDCSPGTNTMVAGWGQWGGRKKKKTPCPLSTPMPFFVQEGRMSFASQQWEAGLWEDLIQCDSTIVGGSDTV